MNNNSIIYIIYIYIYGVLCCYALDTNNNCINKNSSRNATCIPIDRCPRDQQVVTQGCGNISLVCCVDKKLRKSKQKCKEYEGIVAKMTESCFFPKPVPLIVVGNGDPADAREFPHMVALAYQESPDTPEVFRCGGTLISKNFVLTAAHCLFTREYGAPKFARVGDLDLLSDTDKAQPQSIKISKMTKHPGFNGTGKYNDIALLELEKDVQFSPYTYPACLPESEEVEDFSNVIITGWGNTNAWGDQSHHLLKADLEIIPHANCSSYYKTNQRRLSMGISSETHICAGTIGVAKDACSGDSGGPLQRFAKEFCMYDVVGVTSFGQPCLLTPAPGVYTKVYPYIDWIESIVWP